ncbi:MAG TPA: hypothetical protein ACFCU0_12010 [Longibacter sp.]|jgi:hypothetical protein
MKKIGIGLVILGIVGFLLSSVSFSTQETVVDAGPVEVEKEEEQSIPVPSYAAGALVVVGGVLIVVDWQRNG